MSLEAVVEGREGRCTSFLCEEDGAVALFLGFSN